MGELAGGPLYAFQLADRLNEPVLTQWDAWGNRIDRIEVSPLWKRGRARCRASTARRDRLRAQARRVSRVHQFALVYLFTPSTDVYTCPLAMTDGAARTLLCLGQPRADRARAAAPHRARPGRVLDQRPVDDRAHRRLRRRPHRDRRAPGRARAAGGSTARKWFTSATTSQMALTLGAPRGQPAGRQGLALFYVETRDAQGRSNGILVNRLKDKLGTRKVPTAELTLDGARGDPVVGSADGVRNITPMLNVTRTWNA